MKRWLVFSVAAAMSLAAIACAQIDPDPDGIGIYADLGATRTSVAAPVGEPFEVYLLITRPSAPVAVSAWSCGIIVPDNAAIWGWSVAGSQFVNLGTPPDFEVAYGLFAALPKKDVVHLMTFIVFLTDDQPAEFFVRENSNGNYDWPGYLEWLDPGTLVQLHPWPRDSAQPAFCANPAIGTPTESATWGLVKDLYR